MTSKYKIIGFPHPPQKHGGPGSFQLRLEKVLKSQGWSVVYPDDKVTPDVILVVGGTKKLGWLWHCKRKGVRIVHRLDGLNWQHKILPCSFKDSAMAEIRNRLFKTVRNYFADQVIYQSEFIKECWYKYSGAAKCPESVIHNAVDLDEFKPPIKTKPSTDFMDDHRLKEQSTKSKEQSSFDLPNLICVEGTIQSNPAYTEPLKYLASNLKSAGLIGKAIVCGSISDEVRVELEQIDGIEVKGSVKREEIPALLNRAVYLCLEVNPPCPNSVIEALASGCPVIGFDSGALKELVPENAGSIVSYGGDPWALNVPEVKALFDASAKVFENFELFSRNARKAAEDGHDVYIMCQKYLAVLENDD